MVSKNARAYYLLSLMRKQLMENDIRKDFGLFIVKLRNKYGYTQEELAGRSDLSVPYISKIENAKCSASLDVIYKLLLAFDLSLYDLLPLSYQPLSEEAMINKAKEAYKHWKQLNNIISNDLESRMVNFPEAISENIACSALGYTRNNTSVGDATDANGNLIEIKATSNYHSDLTSFSPVTKFDKLIFVRLNLKEDIADIYDLGVNGKEFGSFKVNKNETVADHQQQGRRPRLSLIKYIEQNNLSPIVSVDLK